MKSSKDIINHIKQKPQYSKLLELQCYKKVIDALPPHIGKSVAFIYRRGYTLFFALNHPGIKMEFDYKHNLIKSLLEKLKESDKNCQNIKIDVIKSFVTNIIYKQNIQETKKSTYRERAKGNFLIESQNSRLKNIFIDIKKSIKDNAKSNR